MDASAVSSRLSGSFDERFEEAARAFARCFEEMGETGGGVSVYFEGREALNLWGGLADEETGRPWSEDTLMHVYSVSKPFVAACLLLLVDRGEVALDERVAAYWPEFAQAGKGQVTVRELLSHQAGLLGLRAPQPPEAIFDWERMTSLLAAEAPWWEPGTEVGEHAYFYGHLVGEVVRRVTGQMPGEFFRREIGGPWRLDFHFGLTAEEQGRTANVRGMDDEWRAGLGATPGSLYDQAMGNPPGVLDGDAINSRAWREAQVPAVNGHGTARAVARFYAGVAAGGVLDGVRVFSADIVREVTSVQAAGEDRLLGRHVHWGLGFQIDDDGFGMGGLGGALGWGNAEHQFGFGYVTARMWNHDRALAVFDPAARAAGFTPVE